jgi:hypothetical protein
MLKAEMRPDERKIVLWDWTAPGFKAIVVQENPRSKWRIEIESDTLCTANTVTESYIPVLEAAAKLAAALGD